MNDDPLRPVIGRGGLVVVIKGDQVLAACAARGMSLEELRLAARLSRPTLQAALRGQASAPEHPAQACSGIETQSSARGGDRTVAGREIAF